MIDREDFSGRVKSAFADIKPSQELISRLNKNNIRRKNTKISFIKAAAVASAFIILGGAGVYAASELNFINVFGDYVYVADSELADSLVGSVHNFRYKVSDDAYAIRVNGVVGDSRRMMLMAEIYRKDGTPVIDYFKNVPEDTDEMLLDMPEDSGIVFANCGAGMDYKINKDGNIQLYYDMYSDPGTIKGKKFYARGSDVYPITMLSDFCDKNNIQIFYDANEKKSAFITDSGSNELSDISDEEVIGIRLDWNFSFRYNPSEKSEIKKKIYDIYEDFDMIGTGIFASGNSKEAETSEEKLRCTPSKIEFSSIGGEMVFSFEDRLLSEENSSDDKLSFMKHVFPTECEGKNDIYIVNTDGSRTDLVIQTNEESASGNIRTVIAGITYVEFSDKKDKSGNRVYDHVFKDVSEFKELHINGKVYELV